MFAIPMTKPTRRVSTVILVRGELVRQTLASIATSMAGAAPIFLGVIGPVLAGVLALAVAPLLYAGTLYYPNGVLIFSVHTALTCMPIFFLRHRVLPTSFMNWAAGQPISPLFRLAGDVLAVAIGVSPLAGIYAMSSLVWAWQWPPWLRSAWLPAYTTVLVSLLFNCMFGMLVLNWRWRVDRSRRKGTATGGPHSSRKELQERLGFGAGHLVIARYLLWLPYWRQKPVTWHLGQVATTLLIGVGLVYLLLNHDNSPWQAAISPSIAVFIVCITLWRDATVQRSLAHLLVVVNGWPIAFARLRLIANVWAVLPAMTVPVLALFVGQGFGAPASDRASLWWFAVAAAAGAPMVVLLTKVHTPQRWAMASVWAGTLIVCGGSL